VITNLLRRVEELKKKEADLKEELKKKEAHMCEELKKKEAHMCKELKKKEAYLSRRLGISIFVNVVLLFIMCIMILQFV
jgi:FtsZ-binding cell division protein ZapB